MPPPASLARVRDLGQEIKMVLADAAAVMGKDGIGGPPTLPGPWLPPEGQINGGRQSEPAGFTG
jgi:hypothetical protein